MRKLILFVLFGLFLTACAPKPIISPMEQIQETVMTQEVSPTVHTQIQPTSNVKNKAMLYQCKQKKHVKLIKTTGGKNQSVRVEFNQASHRLSPVVTRSNYKKYSNIRWIWTENFKGVGMLKDKNGKILAENCIKK